MDVLELLNRVAATISGKPRPKHRYPNTVKTEVVERDAIRRKQAQIQRRLDRIVNR